MPLSLKPDPCVLVTDHSLVSGRSLLFALPFNEPIGLTGPSVDPEDYIYDLVHPALGGKLNSSDCSIVNTAYGRAALIGASVLSDRIIWDEIVLNLADIFGTAEMKYATIEAWFRVPDVGVDGDAVNCYAASDTRTFGIGEFGGTGRGAWGDNSNGAVIDVDFTPSAAYHQYVVVRDDTSLKLYVDAVEVGIRSDCTNGFEYTGVSGGMDIGANVEILSLRIWGATTDVAALSTVEIEELYDDPWAMYRGSLSEQIRPIRRHSGGTHARQIVGTDPIEVIPENDEYAAELEIRLDPAYKSDLDDAIAAAGGGPYLPDPTKLDDLAAPDDNTDLDSSTTKHGLMKKFPGGTTDFLRADGAFAVPPGGGGGGGDETLTDAYGSRPSPSNDGDLFFPSDGFYVERDTGAAWVPWGPLFPMTAPVDGDYAWINQGGASVSTTKGGIFLNGPATAGNNLRIRKKAAPSTPYTITAAFFTLSDPRATANVGRAGLVFRQSSDGKLHGFFLYFNGVPIELFSSKFTDATTFSAHYPGFGVALQQRGGLYWLRIADDGTNRKGSISSDGQNWVEVHSVSRTDHLTADEVGFFVNANDATYGVGMTLLSWKQG